MSMSKEELAGMTLKELKETLKYQEDLYPRVKAMADKEEVQEYAADMYDRLGRIDTVCSQMRQEIAEREKKLAKKQVNRPRTKPTRKQLHIPQS